MKKSSKVVLLVLAMLTLTTSCTKKSSEKQIFSFRFLSPELEASIDEVSKTISVTMPYGTDVTNLTPIIEFSEKATVDPGSGIAQDFTNPVTYTVTAEDGSQVHYYATVTLETPSNEKRIVSFLFEDPGIEAIIDEELKTVEAILPFGTDLTVLVPLITISEKATIDPTPGTPTDFTAPVSYTVTAEDGSQAVYTATITTEIPANPFIGVWGVERVDYYNTDYAGNPILSTIDTYYFVLGDPEGGIDMVFREDNTGEIRNRSLDTIYVDNQMIVCPDTTIITPYTYSFDADSSLLYLNTPYIPYIMKIVELTLDSFVYECEYYPHYIEKSCLKRLSDTPMKSTGKKTQQTPHKPGSFLGGL